MQEPIEDIEPMPVPKKAKKLASPKSAKPTKPPVPPKAPVPVPTEGVVVESEPKKRKRKMAPPLDPNGPAVIKSQLDPTLRTPNYKEPTPDSEWKPWWKPRKRPVGNKRNWLGQRETMKIIEEELGADPGQIDALPRDADGRVIHSEALDDLIVAYVSQGGTLWGLSKALSIPRQTIYGWVKKGALKERYEKAKAAGADALAEKALLIATTPLDVEDVVESFDGNGDLVRRDVKRSDATYARKLALHGITSLISKWAPEKYGEKLEAKTTESMASRILEARKRVASDSSEGTE